MDDGTGGAAAQVIELGATRAARLPGILGRMWNQWSALAAEGAGGVPWRADATPARLGDLLPHVLMADRVESGCLRVATGGAAWQALLGGEVRGLPVRAFFDLAERERADALLDECCRQPASVALTLLSDGATGFRAAKMLALPLRGGSGETSKILLGLSMDGCSGEAPTRFAIRSEITTRLAAPRRVERPVRRETPVLRLVE